MNKKVLIILQCAYGNTKRRRRQLQIRKLWLHGLWNSYTGKRLKRMLPENITIEVINSTPKIGDKSSACFQPDPIYVAGWIEAFEPDLIIACGLIAQKAMDTLGMPYLAMPHPAWRQLKNEQLDKMREEIIQCLD